MNASYILALVGSLVAIVSAVIGVRYTIRRDRADGAAAALAQEERQAAAIRQAITDATAPLREQITNLRTDIRDLRVRRDELLDELRGSTPRPRPERQ